MILSSPLWLYQLWAFIAPGLYARERRWAYFFVGAAVPLFAIGGTLAYFAMTKGLHFLLLLVPNNVVPIITINTYLSYAVAMLTIFGIAFELPLAFVLLNVAGVLTHERFAKWRRMIIFLVFAFAAVATPSPDPISMLLLAVPCVVLVEAAEVFAFFNDRRRARAHGRQPVPGPVARGGRRVRPGRAGAGRGRGGGRGRPVRLAPAGPLRVGPMTTSASPADRYAASRQRREADGARIAGFRQLYDFEFDEFQLAACRALDSGHGVLVAAPTGSGKTVVGEFAVHLALAQGQKCFYTTPIKALSNQKYNDLVRRYSAARVGLLTGDNSINSEAPVVVMTTEVLRNMLYAGSPTLAGLATWSWTRCTTWPTGCAARSGRR